MLASLRPQGARRATRAWAVLPEDVLDKEPRNILDLWVFFRVFGIWDSL